MSKPRLLLLTLASALTAAPVCLAQNGLRYSGCGTLAAGPDCLVFLPADGSPSLFVQNPGTFGAGDSVFVEGELNPASTICMPEHGAGIENNTIGGCFDGCGTLVRGIPCIFLE